MAKNHANAQKMQKLKKMNSGGKAIDASIAKHLFFKNQKPKEVQTVEDFLENEGEITICKSKAQ